MDKQKVKQMADDSDNIQEIQLENRHRLEKQEILILKKLKLPKPPLLISTSLPKLLFFKKN
ncbi:unnamed protein product [Paramecium primaurelia]|uniref:Uncharacterized protein n=1 Tax=Paramecium primaurelia TaxID=5886 RepID=A0A8S1MRT5_PARPR|nr:unnamed protein product [Paramecium primaurelia]